jgi:hypothetical protein
MITNVPEAHDILNAMTAKELREIARSIHGASNDVKIPGYSKMVKAELVRMLSFSDAWYFVGLHIDQVERDTEERDERAASDPENGNAQVHISRYTDGSARADAFITLNGFEYDAQIVRDGRSWVLYDNCGPKPLTIRAGSLNKIAKRWAKRLGAWADRIEITRAV